MAYIESDEEIITFINNRIIWDQLIVNQIKSWTLASTERVRQATDFRSSSLQKKNGFHTNGVGFIEIFFHVFHQNIIHARGLKRFV